MIKKHIYHLITCYPPVIHPCFRDCINGTCQNATNDTNVYVCECLPSYEGINCDQEINACKEGFRGHNCNDGKLIHYD